MKIKSKITNLNKYVILVLISFLITSTIVGVSAATILEASEVSYTGNGQSTVQGALDDLYSKGKLKKDIIEEVKLEYTPDAEGCGTFKTSALDETWVSLVKPYGAGYTCQMYYRLPKDYSDVNIKYIYVNFTSTYVGSECVRFTGGTHYFASLFIFNFDGSIYPAAYPNIYKSNNGSKSSWVYARIWNKTLAIEFVRDASSEGNNFQIRGEPMIKYAEIYYE